MKFNYLVVISILSLFLSSCGGGGGSSSSTTPDNNNGNTNPVKDTQEFGACDNDLFLDSEVVCKTSSVPVLRDSQFDDSISLYTMKVPASGESKGQIWIIDGGPGGDGLLFARQKQLFAQFTNSGWDIMIPMHRGTGKSSPLSCNNQTYIRDLNELPSCIADLQASYGEKINGFSATEAAKDINFLLQENDNGQAQYLVGFSYGTFLLQRYLQLYTGKNIDGVILDGIADINAQLVKQIELSDPYLREFFDLCAADTVCNQGMNGDPITTFQNAIDIIENQSCSGITLDRTEFESLIHTMIGSDTRELAMPLIAKISQCRSEDQSFLASITTNLFNSFESIATQSINQLLYFNVLAIDMTPESLTKEEFLANRDTLLLSSLLDGQAELIEAKDLWNTLVTPADYDRGMITSQAPMLVLQGGLDLATPKDWAETALDNIQAPKSTYAYFPYAGHGTPYYTIMSSGNNCSLDLIG